MNQTGNETTYKFTTTDPLGRMVILKQSTFDLHILGDNNRIEFKGQEDKIKQIIEDPTIVIKDPIENRERFYDIIRLDTTNKIKPVMVVVDFSTDQGDIVTAMRKSTMSDTDERGVVYERSKKRD